MTNRLRVRSAGARVIAHVRPRCARGGIRRYASGRSLLLTRTYPLLRASRTLAHDVLHADRVAGRRRRKKGATRIAPVWHFALPDGRHHQAPVDVADLCLRGTTPNNEDTEMALRDDAVGAFFDATTEWTREVGEFFGPKSAQSRRVVVPDFLGMSVSQTPAVAVRAGIKRRVIRLVDPPPPVDGIVVNQDPAPGSRVARGSAVTLTVLHQAEQRR